MPRLDLINPPRTYASLEPNASLIASGSISPELRRNSLSSNSVYWTQCDQDLPRWFHVHFVVYEWRHSAGTALV